MTCAGCGEELLNVNNVLVDRQGLGICPVTDKPHELSGLDAQMPTQLAMGATAVHELYTAYTAAGFTDRQALWLAAYLASAGNQRPPDGD